MSVGINGGILPSSPEAGPSQSPRTSTSERSPRTSIDQSATPAERIAMLEEELDATRQEKEVLGNQYRTLLGKLTAMRQSLGDKLREDAEELDRRETSINTLQYDNAALHDSLEKVKAELVNANNESTQLSAQLAQLRNQSESSSSDVLSLTREMRELRGEMERLRVEREEWENEAGNEKQKREMMEEEVGAIERREMENRREWEKGKDQLERERQRADNLQEVLSEFQAAKDSELYQATHELESQLRSAATALSEFKLRAANAETRLGELSNDATKSASLTKELKDKNQIIGKLRHEAVVNNEHLTEALRRLRKNSSDNNVDRRLVTNILLSFLTTRRADSKRFEMLSLLATILSWNDTEREKAGLQRVGASGLTGKNGDKGKGKGKQNERSAEEEAAMNESFSNLFVEFLLKEASQGESRSTSSPSHASSPVQSPAPVEHSILSFSPPDTNGANTPMRPRGYSNSSNFSGSYGPGSLPAYGRKSSWGLQQALSGDKMDRQ